MSTIEKDHMVIIFRAAQYLVKSNQAFKKFPLLIELEDLEGIKFMESVIPCQITKIYIHILTWYI